MRVLAIGDIVGRPGRRILRSRLPSLREDLALDLVVANAENAAGGIGITPAVGRELLDLDIDLLTMGNHSWGKKEAYEFLRSEARIVRPANYPKGAPGQGWTVVETGTGVPVGVVNLGGRVYFTAILDCPFRTADAALEEDGRVSAVFGTHTHVQTADARVLPGGTGYITDLGMTGPVDSVIGVEKAAVIRRFITQLPERFEVASGPAQLTGAVFDIDEESGLARRVELVRVNE